MPVPASITVNYTLAEDYADIVHALAIIESNETPFLVGDDGQALGLLQQHPSFLQDYVVIEGDFAITTHDTYIDMWIKAAARFFHVWIQLGLDGCVQAYNVGVNAYLKGARNAAYLERFGAAYSVIRSGRHKCPHFSMA